MNEKHAAEIELANKPTGIPAGKHISLPRAVGEKWLGALRGDEFVQGFGSLRSSRGGYCCLGVLQMVLDGHVETYPESGTCALSLPSHAWLDKHGIAFNASSSGDRRGCAPYLERFGQTADGANDGQLVDDDDDETVEAARINTASFALIADALEAEFHYTDDVK